MTGQGTETGRNALAGLPAVQSRRLHRNRLYRRGERTFSSLGRRTSATLQDDTAWNYSYNQRSEITSAIRKNASNVTQNNMRYVFDNIGNRTSSYEDATSKTYDANCLNQYTEIDVTGGSSVCPLYDDDGNMTQFDSSTYTYDAENRLVGAQNGTTRLEFIYDALGRRVARKLYLNNTLSKHHRYVYDGMKLLATYNAKSSFAKINSFLWQPFGLDVPLIMTYNSTVYGYLVDANKNVLGLFNPSGTRVATYLYGPFGQKLSESGTIAANNPIQFSSEQFDADLDLVYYNFRYYFPAIGKWLTKDPIGEEGGWNLYAFCRNDAVNSWDMYGVLASSVGTDPCTVFFIVGHNNDIVKEINKSRALISMSKYIVLSCGGDENSKIRQIADNGDILAPRISSAHLKLKASKLKKGVDLDNLDPVTKYFVETIRKSEFASHLLNEYMGDHEDNPSRIFHIFLIAIFDIIQKEMNKMARDINCKKCCPKGVKAEIVILDSLGFGSMNKDKKSPYLSLDHLEVIHNRIIPCE